MHNFILPISAVVFTKNEEINITECLNSLKNFGEIVVLDSSSIDRTAKIASELGARVIVFKWNGKYPKKRQWSLEQVEYKNDWILFVDADERITVNFVTELRDFMTNSTDSFSAASIPIDYYFAGKRLKHGQRPRKTALLRVGKVKFPVIDDLAADGMGELEGHYQPMISGKTRNFRNSIKHNDNDPISTWMSRHINYAKWEAHLLMNPETKIEVDSSKSGISAWFHKLPLRSFAFFIYSYFMKFGFLDGRAGFDYAFAKSWYYWLSDVIAREKKQNATQ
jgi:glycosyltransferase involved in cell wall biosynthesis